MSCEGGTLYSENWWSECFLALPDNGMYRSGSCLYKRRIMLRASNRIYRNVEETNTQGCTSQFGRPATVRRAVVPLRSVSRDWETDWRHRAKNAVV